MAKEDFIEAPKKIKLSTSSKVFYGISYAVVLLMAIICLIPFLLLISGSVTSLTDFPFFPENFPWRHTRSSLRHRRGSSARTAFPSL